MLKKILLCTFVFIFSYTSYTLAQQKPNIIFILSDDCGIGDIGAYGADNFKTPNIDKLANTGVVFNHCYTAPLCGPSRALILTGRYAFRTGATSQVSAGKLSPQIETMIPAMLKKAGYISASIGKWGQLPLTPADFGFDYTLVYKGSGIYWNTQKTGKTLMLNGSPLTVKDNEYIPDIMHRQAVEFIDQNKNNPFFLYYSLSHIHGPILPTPDSKAGAGNHELYKDNIAYMDKLVGRLMAALDSLHLREKTLVIFTGDNGTAKGWADSSTIRGKRIVGNKATMQEGGGLVPLIANWKSVTPKGKVSKMMIDASDFFATFMEMAGVKSTDSVLDGQSFLPEIKGQKTDHRTWIYNQLARKWYVRELNWKLNESGELYDMSKRLHTLLDRLNPAGGKIDDGVAPPKKKKVIKKKLKQ
jgi:arylsulfatase A